MRPALFGSAPALVAETPGAPRGTVVLFHGLGADALTMHKELALVRGAGFNAVGIDAPMHGRRHHDDRDQRWAHDRDVFMDELVDGSAAETPEILDELDRQGLCGPYSGVGISLGGFILWRAMAREPRITHGCVLLGSPTLPRRLGGLDAHGAREAMVGRLGLHAALAQPPGLIARQHAPPRPERIGEEMPEAVIVSDETVDAMTDLLLASTTAARELAGTCTHRSATEGERLASGLDGRDVWVLDDFRTTTLGDAAQVKLGVPGPGELSWHTHPGLRFSMAGFSEQDTKAVQATGRPLLVLGYTFAAPDTLSWLMVLGGWQGVAATALVQAALRAEASGRMESRLSRIGVAARLLLSDGTLLPVRRSTAAPWQRVLETGTFHVDRVGSKSAVTANRWLAAAWQRVK